MKKLLIAFAALAMSFSLSNNASAQCNPSNFCGSFFNAWTSGGGWQLLDPAGNRLWDAANCDIVWGAVGGPLATGDFIIFDVAPCQSYTFFMCGLPQNNFDAVMTLWTNEATPQLLAFNDDFCAFAGPSALIWDAPSAGVPNGSVLITINEFFCNSFGNNFDIIMVGTCSQPCVANDECANAEELCCATPAGSSKSSKSSKSSSKSSKSGSSSAAVCLNSSALGSTVGASCDNTGGCGTAETAPGVWYKITATETGVITASTCSPNTNYDTKLSVFEGDCNNLVCVGGNDDDFALPCVNFQSRFTWCVTAGSTYFIQVHGFGFGTGDFEISVECGPVPADNDDIENAHCLIIPCGGTVEEEFNNLCATADGPSPGAGTTGASCNSTDGWCSFETNVDNDLWWSFTAPCVEGNITITAGDGSGFFDTQIAVWASGGGKSCKSSVKSCKSKSSSSSKSSKSSKSAKSCKIKCQPDVALLQEVAANDDNAIFEAGLTLNIPNDLVPNQTYWIQVDGFAGTTGQGTLSVNHSPTDCSGCGAGTTEATVVIQTDEFGGETSWELNDIDAGVNLGGANGLPSLALNVSTFCVADDHCFEFVIFDSFGDGICGCASPGFYGVSVNGGGSFVSGCWTNTGCSFAGTISDTTIVCGGNKDVAMELANDIKLNAYPNPISESATFEFTLTETDNVSVDVINLKGDMTTNIFGGTVEAGVPNKVQFNATNFASGIYFVQVAGTKGSARERIVIIK